MVVRKTEAEKKEIAVSWARPPLLIINRLNCLDICYEFNTFLCIKNMSVQNLFVKTMYKQYPFGKILFEPLGHKNDCMILHDTKMHPCFYHIRSYLLIFEALKF